MVLEWGYLDAWIVLQRVGEMDYLGMGEVSVCMRQM